MVDAVLYMSSLNEYVSKKYRIILNMRTIAVLMGSGISFLSLAQNRNYYSIRYHHHEQFSKKKSSKIDTIYEF